MMDWRLKYVLIWFDGQGKPQSGSLGETLGFSTEPKKFGYFGV